MAFVSQEELSNAQQTSPAGFKLLAKNEVVQ